MHDNSRPNEAYVYDVFLSYNRAHPSGTWVKDRLYKDFLGYLGEELGRDPKVYFDQEDIQAGEHWGKKLDWALKVSKVLVAVCSARYFYDSEYCRKEWYSFGELEVDGQTVNRPRVPIRYNDGKAFPPEAREIQHSDFSECNYLMEAFYKNDTRAIIYEDNVRALARAVVVAISNAPEYTAAFAVCQPAGRPVPVLEQPRL